MWTSVLAGWIIFVPPVYFTISIFHGGLTLAWIWATFYIISLSLIFSWRFRRGKWKTIDLIGEPHGVMTVPMVVEERLPVE
jgi:Na+-driven multidrug efflux pump